MNTSVELMCSDLVKYIKEIKYMIKMAVLVSGGNTSYGIPVGTKPDGL